MAISSNAVC